VVNPGDQDALRPIYDSHKDRGLFHRTAFFSWDVSAASDVTQQVFLKLMTSIGQIRGDARPALDGGLPRLRQELEPH
jgi:hypothetical protein